VVAVQLAHERAAGIAGLALVGTSHPRDVDLSVLRVPVTKIVGTRDGLASREEVERNRALLPAATRWVWIEGGNHSQFGWYGFQPGDRPARIAASAQRAAMVEAIVQLVRRVEASRDAATGVQAVRAGAARTGTPAASAMTRGAARRVPPRDRATSHHRAGHHARAHGGPRGTARRHDVTARCAPSAV
jgi:hypothetical protein